MILHVCAVCHDQGITLDDDGRPEFCDCARGEDLAEAAEQAAMAEGWIASGGEPPW